MPSKQPRPRDWNEQEAALLLEGLSTVLNKDVDRKHAVKYISLLLRSKAAIAGEKIDLRFRNEAGIELQMHILEKMLKAYPETASKSSAVFAQTIDLYYTNRSQFDKILAEAKEACLLNPDKPLL